MSIEIVNGYPCADCADIAKAKRGIDPALAPAEELAREAAARDGAARDHAPQAVAEAAGPRDARIPLEFARYLDRLV